jgi:hypothetical protein
MLLWEPPRRREAQAEVGGGNLGSDVGADAIALRARVEACRTVDTIAIEQSHRRHLQFGSPLRQLFRLGRSFEEAEGAGGV